MSSPTPLNAADASAYTITKRLRRLPRLATRADTRDTTPPDSADARRPAPGPRLPPGAAAVLDQLDQGREFPALLGRLVRCVRAVTEEHPHLAGLNPTSKPTWTTVCAWLDHTATTWRNEPWCLDWLDAETERVQLALANRIHEATGRCAYCDTDLEPYKLGALKAAVCPGCDRVAHMRLEKAARLDDARRALGLDQPTPDATPAPILGREAADALGLSWHTVRSWDSRGLLAEAGRDRKGRKLYRLDDVRRVSERATA